MWPTVKQVVITNEECSIPDETRFQQKQRGKSTILGFGKFSKLFSVVRQKTHAQMCLTEFINNV